MGKATTYCVAASPRLVVIRCNPIPHGVAPQQSSAMLRIAVQSYTIIDKHYPKRLKYVPAI